MAIRDSLHFNDTIPLAIEQLHILAIENDSNGNPIYLGVAAAGTLKSDEGWQIKKLTFDASNNLLDIQFANGTITFVAVWDNRSTYQYS